MFRTRRRRPARPASRFRPALAALESRLVLSTIKVGAGTHPADVLSWHDGTSGTGTTTTETALSPATVTPSTFGKLFSVKVDGQVYAQPLYVQALKMADGKVHSVLFVATEDDQVYALDATSPTAGPKHDGVLWHDSLIAPRRGITPVSSDDVNDDDISPNIGITGTPTIDPKTNAQYLVAKTKETRHGATSFVQKLDAIDLRTGAIRRSTTLGTTTVAADGRYVDRTAIRAAGTGAGSTDGTVTFNALREDQRAGLVMDDNIAGNKAGMLVVAYSSHGDINPYHGWVLGFDPRTLKLESTYITAPDGDYGAIWQGGGAPSIAPNGDIIAAVGNGTFDAFTSTATPGASAIGNSGPGLGFEGLNRSVAVAFNAVDPSTGTSGTGLYYGGTTPVAAPVAPNQHESLQGTGIDFNAAAMAATPHTFAATIAYDGSTLSEAIRDEATGALYVHNYNNVDIPAAVGGNTAYVGFGGSTDGLMAVEDIRTWTLRGPISAGLAVDQSAGFASNSGLTLNGTGASFTGGAAELTDGGGEEAGTVFANTPVDVTRFVTTFEFRFAAPSGGDSGGSSSTPADPIGDGITFILQNANGHAPGPDYGESVLDLRPTGRTMTVVDSFTPTNYLDLIQNDKDLGSTAVLLLPSFPGTAHPDLAVLAGKSGTIYLVDRDNLGGYSPDGDRVIQEIANPSGKGFFASPTYSNGVVYYQAQGDVLRAYRLALNPATNTINLVPASTSTVAAKFPGTSPSSSSDGAGGGIVWTLDVGQYKTDGPAVLRAYDAGNLGDVLFDSSALAGNQAGPGVKFVSPTIANGRVYAGLNGEVDVYGLLADRGAGS